MLMKKEESNIDSIFANVKISLAWKVSLYLRYFSSF